MDGQWTVQVEAYEPGGHGYTQSFRFEFPAESVIAQISLSMRQDIPDADLVSVFPAHTSRTASAHFSEYGTADGTTHGLSSLGPYVSSFMANNLTWFSGYLAVRGCWAQAIINVFVWPSVYS